MPSKPISSLKLTKKTGGKKKGVCKKKNLLCTVVDCHHHVMKPMWDAVASDKLPSKGVTLLHFDSHPDMGTIGAEEEPGTSRHKRVERLTPKIFDNSFNKEECLRLSDIATWIPTLVAQGLVDEVIWVAGWWCSQFPRGTFDLLVGQSKKDGLMKIAFPGNKKPKIAYYWDADGSVEREENLVKLMPWRLTICKFQKNCDFPQEDIRKMVKLCKNKPWILDIDEDYLSCQNPFATEFKQLFGEDMFEDLCDVWDADAKDDLEYSRRLESIVRKDRFFLTPAKFQAHEDVMAAKQQLVAGGMTNAKAEKLMGEFRKLCQTILPAEDEEDVCIRDVWDSDLVVNPGSLSQLPHHISSLPQIVELLKSTRRLFEKIKREPGVITVATSRADYYTPEQQANTINTLTLDMLTDTWADTRNTRVIRRDFRSPLSIDDRYDPITPSLLALFLSKGKKNALPPASRMDVDDE